MLNYAHNWSGKDCGRGEGPRILVRRTRGSAAWAGKIAACLILSLFQSSVAVAASQSGTNDFRFHIQQWTTEHGLPQNTITALAQSKDGYMWIGTRAGVARFDGVRFTTFAKELFVTEPGNANVLQICADEQDGVWIRTQTGFFHHGRNGFARYAFGAAGWPDELFLFTPAKGGGVWLAARGALILFRDGAVVRRFDRTNGLPCDVVDSIHWDAEQRLWITREFHLWRLDGERFVPFATVFGTNRMARAICFESPTRAWFGSLGQLDMLENGRWSAYTSAHGLPTNEWVNRVIVDSDGRRWVRPQHGLLLWNGQRFERISGTDVLPENDIRDFIEDREGGLWVGTGRGGVYRLQARPIRVLGKEDGLTAPGAHTVSTGRDGRLWIGGAFGLSLLESNRVRQIPNTNEFLGHNFTVALEDRRGRFWTSLQDHGLFQLKGNEFVPEPLPVTNSARLKVTALHEDRAGQLWIGAREGLFRRTESGVRAFTAADGLGDAEIRGLAEGADGTMWIGTARGGLQAVRGERLVSAVSSNKLPSGDVRPLHVESDGAVWFSTSAGLQRWKNGQASAINARQGLFDEEVFGLLDDGVGNFWMSSRRGLHRAAAAELHVVAEGRQASVSCSTYGTADGLISTECEGETQPNATRLADGRLCFATARGPALFLPADLVKHDLPPAVVIEQVKADGEEVWEEEVQVSGSVFGVGKGKHKPGLETRNLKIGPGRGRLLEIHYTANAFAAPEMVRFKYRLEPRDKEWREAGAQRLAFFQNLRPGSYSFQVKAANHHGLWSEPTGFSFSIAPQFHETGWFYFLCALGVIGTAGGIQAYRLRVQRRILKLEQSRALLVERDRIARDLHDELGSRLTALALRAELARQTESNSAASLQTLASDSRALAEQMRDVIWAVDPEGDSLEAFTAHLSGRAEDFLGIADVRLRLVLPDVLPKLALSAQARHQLALAAKEALHNVVKHARASEVTLHLELNGGELHLRVADDGIGFDEARPRGRGLANMKARIENLGGRFHIHSTVGRGTSIEMKVPLEKLAQQSLPP